MMCPSSFLLPILPWATAPSCLSPFLAAIQYQMGRRLWIIESQGQCASPPITQWKMTLSWMRIFFLPALVCACECWCERLVEELTETGWWRAHPFLSDWHSKAQTRAGCGTFSCTPAVVFGCGQRSPATHQLEINKKHEAQAGGNEPVCSLAVPVKKTRQTRHSNGSLPLSVSPSLSLSPSHLFISCSWQMATGLTVVGIEEFVRKNTVVIPLMLTSNKEKELTSLPKHKICLLS